MTNNENTTAATVTALVVQDYKEQGLLDDGGNYTGTTEQAPALGQLPEWAR